MFYVLLIFIPYYASPFQLQKKISWIDIEIQFPTYGRGPFPRYILFFGSVRRHLVEEAKDRMRFFAEQQQKLRNCHC